MSTQSGTAPNYPGDDQRITDYVMDEMSPEQRSEFEDVIADDPQVAAAVEQARAVSERLNDFYAAMPQETLDAKTRAEMRLAGDVTEHTVQPASIEKKTNRRAWWALTWGEGVVAAAVVLVIVGLTLPANRAVRSTAMFDSGEAEPMLEQSAPYGNEPAGSAPDGNVPFETSSPAEVAPSPADAMVYRIEDASIAEDAEVEYESTAMEAAPSRSNPAQSAPGSQTPKQAAVKPNASQRSKQLAAPLAFGKKPQSSRHGLGMNTETMDVQLSVTESDGFAGIRFSKESQVNDAPLPGLPGFGPAGGGREINDGFLERPSRDRFEDLVENAFRLVSEKPLSTLSIDVDTASYSKVRSYLTRNQLPPKNSVRIEEMINYFEYDYTAPAPAGVEDSGNHASDPFTAAMAVADCPWESEHRLVRVALQAQTLGKDRRPPCNLVFLIDTSGSMRNQNKLPLVIDGMKLLLKQLRKDDRVAIVVYAGSAGLVLDSTPVKNRKKIVKALSALSAGGSTNGGAGLQLAYGTARDHFLENGVNRVILCSDGDFNVGMTGTDQLVREAKRQAASGIDLTVLGFGMGNHNDAMMEKISNDAEGNYAFVDTIAEARKVLSDQLTGTLVTVAKDVKIQVEFNPSVVAAYRLIGYENRLLAKEDFNNDRKDAGEIGAGHRVTALYEIVPVGSDSAVAAPPVDPLKYQPADPVKPAAKEPAPSSVSDEMLTLKLRYKPPQGNKSTLMTRTLTDAGESFAEAETDFRFAAAVAGFGMQLRGSEYVGSWSYDEVLEIARSATGADNNGLRAEFIGLVERAKALLIRGVGVPIQHALPR